MTGTGHQPPARRRGRPARAEQSGAGSDTREQILTAARRAFAEHGYDRASVRGIARTAGVDSALVHHYFGTKEQVFGAAVADAASPLATALRALPEGQPDQLGPGLTRLFLTTWEDPATRGPLLAIARSAFTNDTAARVFRGFLSDHLAQHLAGRLSAPDGLLRVQLAAAQLVGTAVIRYVLHFEPLASAPFEDVVARLTPAVQHHLTGPAPSATGDGTLLATVAGDPPDAPGTTGQPPGGARPDAPAPPPLDV